MGERALNFKAFVNESSAKSTVDVKELEKYSMGIALCCNGEYGQVYFNEAENHIFVCLGDSNPFEESSLEEYLREAVTNFDSRDQVKITIENEAHPSGEGWQVFDPKKNKFIDCK